MLKRVIFVLVAALCFSSIAVAQEEEKPKKSAADAWQEIQAMLGKIQRSPDEAARNQAIEEVGRLAGAFLEEYPDAEDIQRNNARSLLLNVMNSQERWAEVIERAKPWYEALTEEDPKRYSITIIYCYARALAANGQNEDYEKVAKKLDTVEPAATKQLRAEVAAAPLLAKVKANEEPAWTLKSVIDGKDIAMEGFRGKWVLLDFWATWCPPCKSLMEKHLEPLHKKYASVEKFALVSVGTPWNGDTAEKQKAYAEEKSYHWTKVFDGDGVVTTAHGVRGIPFLVLVDPDGKIVKMGSGFSVIEEVEALLEKSLKN